MPQVFVREVESIVVEPLHQCAEKNGRSMEEALAKLQRIQADFAGRTFSDSVELLREDRKR